MSKILQKKYLQYIFVAYTVILTALLLFAIIMIPVGFNINAHATSITGHVMQILFILFNIICLVFAKRWVAKLLIADIAFLSVIQLKTWIALLILLIISIILVIFKYKNKSRLIKCVLIQSVVCVLLCMTLSSLGGSRFGNIFEIQVHNRCTSPNGEYVIESVETYTRLKKTDSYFECRKNDDISLLIYRLEYVYRPIGAFEFSDNDKDIPVEWISDTEFSIDNNLYSVNDFPIYKE